MGGGSVIAPLHIRGARPRVGGGRCHLFLRGNYRLADGHLRQLQADVFDVYTPSYRRLLLGSERHSVAVGAQAPQYASHVNCTLHFIPAVCISPARHCMRSQATF